jgi:coenzyme PQQ synthesis protein D (PqqD)
MSDVYCDPTAHVRLRERSLAWRRVAGEVVVLDIDSSHYHAINASGGAIWDLVAEGSTVAELIASLAAAYPQAADRAGEDVRAFLVGLHERGLLEVVER